MLEACRRGTGLISFSVEKSVLAPRSWRPKWTKFFIGLFPPCSNPLEYLVFPTCRKLAIEAMGLLVGVLK